MVAASSCAAAFVAALALSPRGEVMRREAYSAPRWVPEWLTPPASRLRLGHLPTPIEAWPLEDAAGCRVAIKRDDYSGSELSGNKVRKLEFLLAAAKAEGCDCVVTVGGIQSNHCRATAVAARRVGLEPFLVQRSETPDEDPGLVGNLLVSRMVGAQIRLASGDEFEAVGGWALALRLADELRAQGRRPYAFPSGGSSPLGTWGYLEMVAELEAQLESRRDSLDRIYFACGSGGTAAGLALGLHLSPIQTQLVGLCVDDTPDVFYDKLDAIYADLGARDLPPARDLLRLEPCVGAGYAVSTQPELDFLLRTARHTGVLLDPVYSGKAALGMLRDLRRSPVDAALFVHTGGHLGLYAKESQFAPLLQL